MPDPSSTRWSARGRAALVRLVLVLSALAVPPGCGSADGTPNGAPDDASASGPTAPAAVRPEDGPATAASRDPAAGATTGDPVDRSPGVATPRPRPAAGEPVSYRAEFEAIAEALTSGSNPFLGRAQLPAAREQAARTDVPPDQRVAAWARYAVELLRLGKVDQAVAELEAARDWASSQVVSTPMHVYLDRMLGLAALRQAEVRNCVRRHNKDCCLLPLQGGGRHVETEPAAVARDAFLRALSLRPGQLDAMWLLNIAAMALGEYPDGLPEHLRVPEAAFASEQEMPRLVDVAPELGVDTFNLCGGALVEDLDGDGILDIATSTFDPHGPLTVYRGLPGLAYEDVSAAWRADDQLGGLNLIGNDVDEDGDVDLLVLRGAWLYDDGRIRNSLLRNDGGLLVDVTREAGLAEPARPTQAACFGDLDDDGDLDLYVGNESRVETDPTGDYPSQLFLNDGSGRFLDVAPRSGVTNDRYAKGVAAGDHDNDGDLDLYVSNVTANRLYRNEGDGRFTDVAGELGVTRPIDRSFACWFFDWNHDGWLDLFVTAYRATITDIAADHLGRPHRGKRPALYQNEGGRFRDVAAEVGLDHPWLPMGASFGDVDGDGWLDVYLATGDPDYSTLCANVMLRNDGGRRFVDVTTAAGLGHLQKGHGVAFADLDDDGDLDLYHQLGGFYPGDGFANALFRNPGTGRRVLVMKLVGTESNRAAVGARIHVVVEEAGVLRSIHRAVGCVSSFGGSPLRQHIGLGDASRIVSVEVRWPTSGTVQFLDEVPLDGRILVTEGEDGWAPLR